MTSDAPPDPLPAIRLPIVGVMGSGQDPCEDLAAPLGAWLADFGVHLLTGGGGGVMAAVSRAFQQVRGRRGLVLGILPGEAAETRHQASPAYPNAWVDLPIYTHLPLRGVHGTDARCRNHINILSSDVVIILPGNEGTRSEAELAARYRKPAIAWFGSHHVPWAPPADIRVAASFADVQRFLRVCVGRVPRPDDPAGRSPA